MKTRTKILLWSIVSVLVIGIAIAAFMWLSNPQIITLSDGTKLTLLGVEYGKHHKYPAMKTTIRRDGGGPTSFDTTNDTLVVWIQSEHKASQWPSYQVLASDKAETACVANWSNHSRQIRQGVEVMGIELNAFPRHDSKIYLRFMTWGQRGQQVTKEQMIISNPARGSFAKWTLEPLPAKQSDGDLDVTLTRLICGVPGFNGGNRSSKDPMNKAVLAAFRTEQKGIVVTNWQPMRIETSDATGNKAQNNNWSSTRDKDEAVMTYQWGLWPEEPAWKLSVEMSRTSGFNDDEAWTIQNVPVNAGRQQDMWNYGRNDQTNAAFAETTLNGIDLKIFPAIQFTDQNQGNGEKRGGFRIMADPDPTPEGYRMTLSKVTDENGRDLQGWNGGSGGGGYTFQLPNLRNAKMLNITIALHKSRFVEFTVKPTKQ